MKLDLWTSPQLEQVRHFTPSDSGVACFSITQSDHWCLVMGVDLVSTSPQALQVLVSVPVLWQSAFSLTVQSDHWWPLAGIISFLVSPQEHLNVFSPALVHVGSLVTVPESHEWVCWGWGSLPPPPLFFTASKTGVTSISDVTQERSELHPLKVNVYSDVSGFEGVPSYLAASPEVTFSVFRRTVFDSS